MADVSIYRDFLLNGLSEKRVSISGTVKDASGNGLSRQVLGYRNDQRTVVEWITTSASDGSWSVTVNGNLNDKWRIIALGTGGENDAIFGNVVGVPV